MQVSDLMKNVCAIDKVISLSKAAQIMSSKRIGEIVLLNGDKIKGIITEDDLVRNFGSDKNVKDVMTVKVITISGNEGLDKALSIMNMNSVKRLPVIGDSGKLVGIIRLLDIARNVTELDDEFFFG